MSRSLRAVSSQIFILLLPACASSSRVSYDTLASDFQTLEAHQQRGRDAAIGALAGERLERPALIRAVLDRNPGLESVRQAWSAALARYRQAGAWDDPMLMASFAPLSIASTRAPFGYQVEVSQRVPLGGKLDAQAQLAAAQAQAASSDYAEARLKLAFVASELFDDYAVAVRSLEIQAQHVALVRTLKDNAVAAYASGHAAAQDALQAEAELARLDYQRTVFETARDVAVAQLNALLHRDPNTALPEPAPELADSVSAEADTAAQQKALQHRPDIASAQQRVRVARARMVAANTEFYPDLTLSTSYNSMWSMPEHRWMAGVAFNLPLQRARRHGALDEAAAMQAASENDVQDMLDWARGEVAIAARRLHQAERALQLYEERLVPIARDRIEAARSGFIASQNSFMTVIEAERALREAELELQMNRGELNKRRAALDRALGHIPGLGREDQP